MTSERFAEEIVGMTGTLYRVSYSILREPRDREDAVQSSPTTNKTTPKK